MAALLIVIPIGIVSITEIPFNAFTTKILFCTSLTLIITGKILTVIKKRDLNKSIAGDIGIIIGLLIVLVDTALD